MSTCCSISPFISFHLKIQKKLVSSGLPLSCSPCTCRTRLVSLAAQKFIAGAIHDAMQVHARRQKQPPARLKEAGYDVKDKRPVLLTEDLAEALLEVHTV